MARGNAAAEPTFGVSDLGPRPIHHRYADPVDLIWLHAAARLGMRVERSDAVFASWNGRDTLTLGTAASFDADDSLAQLILHEICHGLVEGTQGWSRPDWGLENTDERDLVREHACHRLQAALAGHAGLRSFFAVTTLYRPYYDALPVDPLTGTADPAVSIARTAWARSQQAPFEPVLSEALASTAAVARAVRSAAPVDTLWATYAGVP